MWAVKDRVTDDSSHHDWGTKLNQTAQGHGGTKLTQNATPHHTISYLGNQSIQSGGGKMSYQGYIQV